MAWKKDVLITSIPYIWKVYTSSTLILRFPFDRFTVRGKKNDSRKWVAKHIATITQMQTFSATFMSFIFKIWGHIHCSFCHGTKKSMLNNLKHDVL